MKDKLAHIPEGIKNALDASAGAGVILTWLIEVTPFLNFAVVLLAIVWGIYRIHDMRLAIKIKQKELDNKEDSP